MKPWSGYRCEQGEGHLGMLSCLLPNTALVAGVASG